MGGRRLLELRPPVALLVPEAAWPGRGACRRRPEPPDGDRCWPPRWPCWRLILGEWRVRPVKSVSGGRGSLGWLPLLLVPVFSRRGRRR